MKYPAKYLVLIIYILGVFRGSIVFSADLNQELLDAVGGMALFFN